MEINGLKNIDLREVALSDKNGVAPIFEDSSLNRGGVSLDPQDHEKQVQTVKLRRLDEELSIEEWRRVKVMKVDVEGWELPVLKGAEGLFKSGHIPALIVEYFRDRGDKALRLYDFLKALPNTAIYKMRYRKRCEGPLVRVEKESDLRPCDNIVVMPLGMRPEICRS
jgi:FkbM family methyltransferase